MARLTEFHRQHCAHHRSELGYVPDGFLADVLRLALGVSGLAQHGRILLSRHLRLLQLGLDL
jgi:hypothetical protein